MDPSWTELAPLSALGHSNIKMQASGGAISSGANTASVPQLWYFCKGGQGQNKFANFLNPFLRRAQSQKLIFFSLFLRQNNTLDRELIITANNQDWHDNYTTNCQREDGPTALVVTTYPIYLIPHKDGLLALVALGPGPALEGGARPLTAPGSHKRPGAGPLIRERRADGPTAWPLLPTHTTHTCRGRCWGRGRGMGMGKSRGGSRGLGRSRVCLLP